MTGRRAALMVIISEPVSVWLNKGEVVDRYYNPGDLFEEVHLVLLNDDVPDPHLLQQLVGSAVVKVYYVPATPALFIWTLGWRPLLLRRWARDVVEIARSIRPALIRCHAAHLNVLAASEVKRKLGVPYVVSLHTNADEDFRGRAKGIRSRVTAAVSLGIEKVGLRNADLVLPVYQPIVPYLQRLGIERYRVAYNVLNPDHLVEKTNYELHHPVRVVSVGRQFEHKNPVNLIKAVAAMSDVELTLVGDGSHHDLLRRIARDSGAGDRIRFEAAIPNARLCELLPTFDLFAVHTEYWEISKSVLEALLTGLPVVVNRRKGQPVPELTPDICRYVDNSVDAYKQALQDLIANDEERAALGRSAFRHARRHWDPEVTERVFADIYRDLLDD